MAETGSGGHEEKIDPRVVEKAAEVNQTLQKPTADALRRAIAGLGGQVPEQKGTTPPAAPTAPAKK